MRTVWITRSVRFVSRKFGESVPDSKRDIFSIELMSIFSLCISFETRTRYSFCLDFGIVPSRIPSTKPPTVVIGVRSSCETLAIKVLLTSSLFSTHEAREFMYSATSLGRPEILVWSFSSNFPFE